MRNCLPLLILPLMALTASAVFADTLHFNTVLSGATEKVPNTTAAAGRASVELDTATKVATYRIEFSGLSGPTTKVHFHGLKLPGMKAPEVIFMQVHAASPVTGTIHLNDRQIAELEHGDWYANVHTEKYPDGEIRGWLSAVP